MHTLLYNLCLLITNKEEQTFKITSLQTDDTLSIVTKDFAQREEEELQKAKFCAKGKTILVEKQLIKFNSSSIKRMHNTVILT